MDKSLETIKRLMNLNAVNESSKSFTSEIVEFKKIGADGKTYGIVRENKKYYIKVSDKTENVLKEDFDYIGGIGNKSFNTYTSWNSALKNFELKMRSINEAINSDKAFDIFKPKKNVDVMVEDTKQMSKILQRQKQIMEGAEKITTQTTFEPKTTKLDPEKFIHPVGDQDPYTDKATVTDKEPAGASDPEKQGEPYTEKAKVDVNFSHKTNKTAAEAGKPEGGRIIKVTSAQMELVKAKLSEGKNPNMQKFMQLKNQLDNLRHDKSERAFNARYNLLDEFGDIKLALKNDKLSDPSIVSSMLGEIDDSIRELWRTQESSPYYQGEDEVDLDTNSDLDLDSDVEDVDVDRVGFEDDSDDVNLDDFDMNAFEAKKTNKKSKITEDYFGEDEQEEPFIPQGGYTVSNSGGYLIQFTKDYEMARVKDSFGGDNPEVSDWLPVEYVASEDGGVDEEGFPEMVAVIDPEGYNIPLNQVMRLDNTVQEDTEPIYEMDEEELTEAIYSAISEIREEKKKEAILKKLSESIVKDLKKKV